MTIEIEYFDDIGKLQADPRAAAALSQARTPFDRPEWWSLLQEHCEIVPMVALACSADGAAVWPFAQSARGAKSLANFYSFTTRPLASSQAAYAALLPAIGRNLRSRFSRLEIERLPEDQGLIVEINAALRAAGWSVACEQDDINHILELGGRDFAVYLASRPGRLRSTVKRKRGKLETKVLASASPSEWAAYEEIYAASWKPDEASSPFWLAFIDQEANAGRLRFGMAFDQERPVAAQIWTVEHGTAFIHKLAHLPDADHLSPGSVLTAKLMHHVIDDDRVHTVDFGTGDDGYKRDWMDRTRPRYRITARDPRDWRNWPALARNAIKARLAGGEQGGYRPANAADGVMMATSHSTDNATETTSETAAADPIDAKLRRVLADILGLDDARVAAFDGDTGLFGYVPELDSQAVATLLTEVEDRFAIVIDDEDVDGEMLETYGGLRNFVHAKCAAAA